MNSRQRVLAAVERRPVDRVPVDFGGPRSSGIMAIAYARLKEDLGIASGGVYVYDVIQQLAVVEPAVLDELGIDTDRSPTPARTGPWTRPGSRSWPCTPRTASGCRTR